MAEQLDRRFCVAPMMDCTDRHERYFLRLLSARAVLYTEMITADAVLHGDLNRLLAFDPAEHPVALQLGGGNPVDLAVAARIGSDYDYDEINLNIGCPSDRVQSGRFGACLMAEPELVGECVASIKDRVARPVTVKTRLGIDYRDSYGELCEFVGTVRDRGCHTFILHARKAWLQGLSPRQNREVPPLDYDRVHKLKVDFPDVEVLINGGIRNLDEVKLQLNHVDGVMLGRAVYENPFLLSDVDRRVYDSQRPGRPRREIVRLFAEYVARQMEKGTPIHQMTRHIVGLYSGMPGARKWRRYLTEKAVQPEATAGIIEEAAMFVSDRYEAKQKESSGADT